MKLYDFSPEAKHMLCFVGQGGAGKSLATSFWPVPSFYASCDGRVASLYNYWMDRDPQRLKEMEFEEYKAQEYDKMASRLEKLQIKNPFKTVTFDPLTMIGDMLIQYSVAQKGGDGVQKRGKITLPGPDEYKTESNGLKAILDVGRSLKSNFILCAHVLEETHYSIGDDKPRITRKLLTAGKQPAAMIPGMFDEVWLFTVVPAPVIGGKPTYQVITRPTMEFLTLRTSANLPVEITWTGKNGDPLDLYKLTAAHLDRAYLEKVKRDAAVQAVSEPPIVVAGEGIK